MIETEIPTINGWRPENWQPCTINNLTNYEGLTHAQCYEAGADAILQALQQSRATLQEQIEGIRQVIIKYASMVHFGLDFAELAELIYNHLLVGKENE